MEGIMGEVVDNYMAEAILTAEQWDSLKAASIKGVCDVDLAAAYGVDRNAIRQRRFRDPIWQAAKTPDITNGVTEGQKDAILPASAASSASILAQKVATTVSDNIAKLGEQNRLLALQIAGKGLKQADRAPPDVQSWQDVKALMDIVAKASGMDQAAAVQVNVLSSQPMDFQPHFEPVIETGEV